MSDGYKQLSFEWVSLKSTVWKSTTIALIIQFAVCYTAFMLMYVLLHPHSPKQGWIGTPIKFHRRQLTKWKGWFCAYVRLWWNMEHTKKCYLGIKQGCRIIELHPWMRRSSPSSFCPPLNDNLPGMISLHALDQSSVKAAKAWPKHWGQFVHKTLFIRRQRHIKSNAFMENMLVFK